MHGLSKLRPGKQPGVCECPITKMFALLFDLEDYATTYRATRDAYLMAASNPGWR